MFQWSKCSMIIIIMSSGWHTALFKNGDSLLYLLIYSHSYVYPSTTFTSSMHCILRHLARREFLKQLNWEQLWKSVNIKATYWDCKKVQSCLLLTWIEVTPDAVTSCMDFQRKSRNTHLAPLQVGELLLPVERAGRANSRPSMRAGLNIGAEKRVWLWRIYHFMWDKITDYVTLIWWYLKKNRKENSQNIYLIYILCFLSFWRMIIFFFNLLSLW